MGKIKQRHNSLIEDIISDPKYRIEATGQIFNAKSGKEIGYTRKKEKELRNKQYKYVTYKDKKVKIYRIIFAKFKDPLVKGMVVHHKDGNGLNNNIDNLEQVSQADNIYYRFNP